MEQNREIGVVIDGRIKRGYLCFTYTPISTILFCFLVKANFKSVSEVSMFCLNSRSVDYQCAIHNLPTLRPVSNELNECLLEGGRCAFSSAVYAHCFHE